jgi:hypothetical protein
MDTSLLARATKLAGLVEETSKALNGCYEFTLTGSVLIVSDGEDWHRKTVTTPDGDTRSEPSINIVKAIEKGWYVLIHDRPDPSPAKPDRCA